MAAKQWAALVFGAVLVVAVAIRSRAEPAAAPRPPGLVFIVVDTLRADRLGCYGYAGGTSPAIDALAEGATLFEQAYATAPWMTPSVASMLTGRYPTSLGIRDEAAALDAQVVTLAELLQEKGYRSKGVISHFFIGDRLGFAQGFDEWDARDAGRGIRWVSASRVSQKAVAFLRKWGHEPFFLFAHFFDPHYDYVMHGLHNGYPDYEGRLLGPDVRIGKLRKLAKDQMLDAEDLRYLDALYDSEVRHTDYYVGRIIEKLHRAGLYDDTLIVVTADHGEELGRGPDGWVGHTVRLSQEIVRVPLLIKVPGQKQGRRVATPVSLVDLMPTLARALDLSVPGAAEGRPIQLGNEAAGARPVFAETRRGASLEMVASGRWKLVFDATTGQHRLYDLSADPAAAEDVADAHPEVAAKLLAMRSAWSAAQEKARPEGDGAAGESLLTDEERLQLRDR